MADRRSSEDSENDSDFEDCDERATARTYLLTYSQADLEKVNSTRLFADIVLEAFNEGTSKVEITRWAACREPHADGGKHYHMIVKLNGTRKWKPVFNSIQNTWGFNVNFSTNKKGYLRGYRYIIKEKPSEMVVHSPGHPDLTSAKSPKSKKGFVKSSQNAKRRRKRKLLAAEENNAPPPPPPPPRPVPIPEVPVNPLANRNDQFSPRLKPEHVMRFIRRNNLKTELELLAATKNREVEGLTDVYNYIGRQSSKALNDLLAMTWRLEEAPALVERQKMSRMEVVLSFLHKPCVEGCDSTWLEAATEVLHNNNINVFAFADNIRKCLTIGRAKYTNILLWGPRNCGKSFLLNPLEDMFKTFINPTEGKYCWNGLDECEVALLQDLRWTPELIKWSDFLVLLEGQTVHLARPRNVYPTDMTISKSNTIPFFATTKVPLVYNRGGEDWRREEPQEERLKNKDTLMMDARWRQIRFTHEMPEETLKRIPECPHCFSVLVTRGMND